MWRQDTDGCGCVEYHCGVVGCEGSAWDSTNCEEEEDLGENVQVVPE